MAMHRHVIAGFGALLALSAGAAYGAGEELAGREWGTAALGTEPHAFEGAAGGTPIVPSGESRGNVDGPEPVPLPSPALLGGAGLALVGARRRRRIA